MVSVISRGWKGDNERLCKMEPLCCWKDCSLKSDLNLRDHGSSYHGTGTPVITEVLM